MRLKSFHAPTMIEAMTAVRDALGDDAIIVATRNEVGGVRITAAVEPEQAKPDQSEPESELGSEPANNAPSHSVRTSMRTHILVPSETDLADELSDLLYRHGVPSHIMDQMMGAALVHSRSMNIKVMMTGILQDLLHFEPLAASANKPVVLVGPPGVGKTLTIAKLATQAHLAGQRLSVFTTDVVRAGGVEQLEAFTKLLGVPLAAAETPGALADGVESVRSKSDLILIDTAGYNPFLVEDMAKLVALLKALGGLKAVDAVLVLPAGSDPQEALDMAEIYQKLGIKRLILTKLDCARRLGGVMTACLTGPFQLLALSRSSDVTAGLIQPTPESFAEILISAPRGRP